MPLAVFQLENVTKIYTGQKIPANDNISLQIQQGEVFGFLGDIGAGKTTLVRQMMNLLKSTSGHIYLFGKLIDSDPLHSPCHIGYMPQESYSLNNMTVGEALYYTARLRGLTRIDAQRERQVLLDSWEIGSLRDQINTRLSGGQRRLLRLAVAMTGRPPVLILDEPTSDLDPQRRNLVWDRLREINAQSGVTVIFITHDAIEAEKVIQRVGIMKQGRLVAVGTPAALKHSIDQKLRLELTFPPDKQPTLPEGLVFHQVHPGRWLVYLERVEAVSVLEKIDLGGVDDFRLFTATLEDLYLHYANQNHPNN